MHTDFVTLEIKIMIPTSYLEIRTDGQTYSMQWRWISKRKRKRKRRSMCGTY